MREIIFDTETTGLSPAQGDRMVEIGCIEMVGRIETGRSWHGYFNPERDMPAEAEKVHGLSAHFLSDKPLFAEKAEELLAFLGEAPLVAHNAAFDFRFLNAELERCGQPSISMDRMIDTADMARRKFPGAPASLDALCSRFGIDRSHRVKHGALLDAELLAQVYIELTGGRQIGLGLAASNDTDMPRSPGRAVPMGQDHSERPVRVFTPDPDELEAHKAFVAQIKNPLWSGRRG